MPQEPPRNHAEGDSADRPAVAVVDFDLPPNLGRNFDVRSLLRRGGVSSRVFRIGADPTRIVIAAKSSAQEESKGRDTVALSMARQSAF